MDTSSELFKNNYLTNFDDSGDYKVKAAVSDSYAETSKEFNVAVKNMNREPVMEEIPLSKVNENEEFIPATRTLSPMKSSLFKTTCG